MTDKHRAVKLRIARKRGDLLAVAVMEGRLGPDLRYSINGRYYIADFKVASDPTESELRALWGDR